MKNSIILLACLFFGIQSIGAQQYPFEVTVQGSGEPIILVPGFSCTSEVWDETVSVLKEDHELHVLTLAGFGGVAPIDFPWLPQIKEGIEKYIHDKSLNKPQFVGHSMGGTLGLWLAAENPELLSKVVCVDGLPAMGALMFPNYDPNNFSYDSPYNKQTLAMSEEQFTGMANQFAYGMTLNEKMRPKIVKWIKQADRETYVYAYTDLLKLDLRPQLSDIETPIVVFAATQPFGKEAVQKNIEKQFKNLENYKLIIAEDSAHFIMFDKPEWFHEQLNIELAK